MKNQSALLPSIVHTRASKGLVDIDASDGDAQERDGEKPTTRTRSVKSGKHGESGKFPGSR